MQVMHNIKLEWGMVQKFLVQANTSPLYLSTRQNEFLTWSEPSK